ncbi:MAG: serine/threonine-protein phosphatase [Clostridia bacterium]|nr:serine/threonine-protein phosphatase [Clostridia bacterium]
MLTCGFITKPGARQINEDAVGGTYTKDKVRQVFVLCDGLGGHGYGDAASNIAMRTFKECFAEYDGNAAAYFDSAFGKVQKDIIGEQKKNSAMSQMKTTLVALVVDGNRCTWAHIGDSRLYYFRDGSLVSRTADHSVPQMLLKAGEITEDQIRFHPDRNKLLRALGDAENEPKYTLSETVEAAAGTAFLLCSDGFWEYITEDRMEKLLRESRDAQDWVNRMCETVEENNRDKKADNYSAITVII